MEGWVCTCDHLGTMINKVGAMLKYYFSWVTIISPFTPRLNQHSRIRRLVSDFSPIFIALFPKLKKSNKSLILSCSTNLHRFLRFIDFKKNWATLKIIFAVFTVLSVTFYLSFLSITDYWLQHANTVGLLSLQATGHYHGDGEWKPELLRLTVDDLLTGNTLLIMTS